MPDIKRILVVRLGALGDIVHAMPAQQALHRAFPDSEIHWVCEPPYRALLECLPGLDRIWLADTKQWRAKPLRSHKFLDLVRQLRRQKFDVVFDFQGLLKSAVLARLTKARRTLGFLPERFKENGIQLAYSEAIAGEGDLTRHVIDSNINLVKQVTPARITGAEVPLQIPPESRKDIAEKMDNLGVHRPILINPGSGWATKLWPARNYAQLALELENEGHQVVFSYGPMERDLMHAVQDHFPRPIPSFPSTIVELAELCRRSRLIIAGDCGPLHLAVAMGTPSVAILGPTARRRNGPYPAEDEIVKRDLPCSNSYKRKCDEWICMDIPVEEVLQAARRRLACAAGSGPGNTP